MTTQRPFIEILDECIDRVLIGRESIDSCIADYPEHAVELRQELSAATAVQQPFAFQPDSSRKRDARLRFQEALDRRHARRSWWRLPMPRAVAVAGPRFVAIAVVAGLALLGSGTGTVLASQGSLPGDLLYPVKTTSESVRLAFAVTASREARLHAEFLDRRVDELEQVTIKGRERFVPRLVRQIERHGAKVHELTVEPVKDVLDELPAAVFEPDASADGRTTVTAAPPEVEGRTVSVRRALALSEQLKRVQSRIAELESKAAADAAKDAERQNLKRLAEFVDRTNQELEALLEKADAIHRPKPEVEAREQRERDRVARERDRGEGGDASVRPILREIEAEVLDVSVHNLGDSARVDVRVRVADGSERVVHITRGGTKLLKAGHQGKLQDLKLHSIVVLVVQRSTGEVVALHVT